MKSKTNFLLVNLFFAAAFVANAQTISLTTSTPTSSATVGGGTSVRIGTGAGTALTTNGNNVFIGNVTGENTTGANNTFVGWAAAPVNTTGEYNTMIGRSAGNAQTTAFYNTFIGALTGLKTTTGPCNTFVGFGAGYENVSGGNNTVTGWGAGGLFNAWSNTIYGTRAGNASIGDGNTLIGEAAGFKAGSGNVMIGINAGYNETGNNKLYIANSNTATPLIWGDFAASQLKLNGKVGIGAVGVYPTNPLYTNYKLFVTGGILTDEIRVKLSASGTWADYVFAKNYNLPTLNEVEDFIAKNGHLKNVPSAKDIKENGIDVAEIVKVQQEKIEELTLYIISQNKRLEALEAKISNK